MLVRPSAGSARWRSLDPTGIDNLVVCPRSYAKSGELDVVLLAESVRHAAVTIGIDGLALTMAAALGKPAVAFVRSESAKAGNRSPLDDLLTAAGNSITVATTLEDVNARVRAVLTDLPAGSTRFLETMVRPQPGASPSQAAADHIERVARGSRRRARPRTSLGSIVLRAPLLLIAGAVNLVGRVGSSAAR